jgi:4-amino-4-deoxy-L-arabinose transferase-like glycosyltransferase
MIIKYLKNYKFEILFFAILGAVLLLNLGASSLWEPDEPRYAEAVREMFEKGDFLTPHYNYEYRFDKPIFYYWMIAGSFKLFGMNDFALRFPSAVLTFLTILFLYLLVYKIYGRTSAVCSSVVLATMFNYIKLGRYAIPDASWIFFITAAFYFFISGLHEPKKANLHMPLGYVMLAFAAITKSPVGVAIPAIVFAIYMVIRKDWSLWKRMRVNIGILILFLISAPWYLYMIFRYKAEYFRYYFVSDHFFRYFTYEFGRSRPVWYYIQILLGDFLPWTLFFVLAFFNKQLRLKNIKDKKTENYTFLILLWGLTVLIIFSLSGTKLPHYISPAYPPFAILTGIYLSTVISGEKKLNIKCRIAQSLVILTFLAAGILLLVHIKYLTDEHLTTLSTFLCGAIPLLFCVGLVYLFVRKKFDFYIKTAGIGLLMAYLAIIMLLMPVYEKTVPLKDISLNLKKMLEKTDKVALYKTINPAIMYYLHKKVIDIQTTEDLEKFLNQDVRVFIITKSENIRDFENNIQAPFYEIDRKSRYLPRFDNFYKKPREAVNFELVLLSNQPTQIKKGYN